MMQLHAASPAQHDESQQHLSRRQLLAAGPGVLLAVMAGTAGSEALAGQLSMLSAIEPIPNPLAAYPNRDWERVYRDLYTPDSTYHYLCAPNDTHGCLLRASVKNGVAVYADASFGYHEATDIYGNKASNRWDPRACVSGLAYIRRAYSDRRVKGCYVRAGFKRWIDDGMPREADGQPPLEYRTGRGKEDFVKVTHEEAAALVAQTYIDVATTYSGEEGAALLEAQGYYEPEMIEAMHEAGTQVLKFRGGMPYNAPFRVGGFYRLTNMLALLDVAVRGVEPDESYGGRHWDSYSWHTDLPPGHPMVTGQQTLDFDLATAENAKLITLWGMNWIATKMPDAHWLTEARLHGAKVVTIAPEYQSSSCKADRAITIRAGSDGALALGLAHVIVRDGLYDERFVKTQTDLPLLVRSDTKKLLLASDVIPGYQNATLTTIEIVEPGAKLPPAAEQPIQYAPADLRESWGDQMVWDTNTAGPAVVTHDDTGDNFPSGVDPALEGTFSVTLVDGTEVEVRSIFDAVKQHLDDCCTPEQISKVTWVPVDAIEELAKDIAANPAQTLFVEGMGPNHFFNNDNKDRTIILVAALTNNVGHYGGTVGSYAGNYRLATFSGISQWIYEDPFNPTLDPDVQVTTNKRLKSESAHYYNYGDRPLKVGNKMFTGDDPHADADQDDALRQLELAARQCQGRPRRHGQHAAEDRDDRSPRVVLDGVVRVRRRGVRRRLVAGTPAPRRLRLGQQPVPAGMVRHTHGTHLRHARRHGGQRARCRRAGRATRRQPVRRLLALRHREEPGRLHPAGVQRWQPDSRLPVRRPPRVVQEGHPLLHDVPHPAEDRRLGADQRERAVVHEVRTARVLP